MKKKMLLIVASTRCACVIVCMYVGRYWLVVVVVCWLVGLKFNPPPNPNDADGLSSISAARISNSLCNSLINALLKMPNLPKTQKPKVTGSFYLLFFLNIA